MFFKKKSKGVPAMHYEGLPKFQQDAACSMEIGEDSIVFTNTAGTSVTLLISKIECIDIMQEKIYMLKYHNSPSTTSKSGAKWYAVITYMSDGERKHIDIWYMSGKTSTVLHKLQNRCAQPQNIEL